MDTYIIDTNILLDYPQIIEDKENKLIILTSVLRELDGLKKHLNQDTAFNARRAAIYISRHIDRLNWYNCDKLDKEKIPVDEQLIVAAKDIDGIVITNDVYLKVRCIISNVKTKGYSLKDDYTGVYYWVIDPINNKNDQNALENLLEKQILPEDIVLNENQYLVVQSIDGEDIDTFVCKQGSIQKTQSKRIKNQWIDCIFPKNPEQKCLFDALNNRDNSIVYAGGKYGSGKSFILNNFALQELEKENIKKIVYIPNNSYTENAMELGFLPGSDVEKVFPNIGPLIDLVGQDYIRRLIDNESLEIVPLAYIRGRSFSDSIIIVNEAQNLTEDHLKLLIARCGEGTRIFFDGDIKQADSQLFRNKNGLKLLLNLRKSPVYSQRFATVKLNTTERSITAQAAQYLDDINLSI